MSGRLSLNIFLTSQSAFIHRDPLLTETIVDVNRSFFSQKRNASHQESVSRAHSDFSEDERSTDFKSSGLPYEYLGRCRVIRHRGSRAGFSEKIRQNRRGQSILDIDNSPDAV